MFFESEYGAKISVARITSLRLEDISLAFGGLSVLTGVSFEMTGREILSIIGPNGAGKTCVLNCISGFYRPSSGKIHYGDKDITRLSSYKIAELGIARTFQNIELYVGMSVLDNVMAGRHIHMRSNPLTAAVYVGQTSKEEVEHRARVESIIEFLEMQEIRKKIVAMLPYGLRKRTELARALAMEPKLLLLDEPMTGMNLEEKEDMARFIIDIYEELGIPVILVEHDMGVVMDISDRVVVMDVGSKIAEGTPAEVRVNPLVIRAYLGEDT
jgi:branched-chain amino acid transport system ATP-binding protein